MWEELLDEIAKIANSLHTLCEESDERYLALDAGPDKTALGLVLTNLKDARSALERAEDAVP
jgi:hypothetical protein